MQCGRRRRLLKPPVSRANLPHPTASASASWQAQLGLTVADRWECSQATGLPAWRHQDLHTQRVGHTVSRALKQKNLYLGTGPVRTLSKSM